jgi:hypothetical protein
MRRSLQCMKLKASSPIAFTGTPAAAAAALTHHQTRQPLLRRRRGRAPCALATPPLGKGQGRHIQQGSVRVCLHSHAHPLARTVGRVDGDRNRVFAHLIAACREAVPHVSEQRLSAPARQRGTAASQSASSPGSGAVARSRRALENLARSSGLLCGERAALLLCNEAARSGPGQNALHSRPVAAASPRGGAPAPEWAPKTFLPVCRSSDKASPEGKRIPLAELCAATAVHSNLCDFRSGSADLSRAQRVSRVKRAAHAARVAPFSCPRGRRRGDCHAACRALIRASAADERLGRESFVKRQPHCTRGCPAATPPHYYNRTNVIVRCGPTERRTLGGDTAAAVLAAAARHAPIRAVSSKCP